MKQLAYDLGVSGETFTDPVGGKFKNITDLLSGDTGLIAYALALAGILLLVYFIWGGFEVLTSTGEPQKIKHGSDRMLQAVVGFVIIFVAYWLVQVVELIFGVEILG